MTLESCILTIKDFTIVEVMYDRCPEKNHPFASILKSKLEAATVVFPDDMPTNVATISSRITFRVNGSAPHTRVLSHAHMNWPAGLFLPVDTLHGMALLGLAEGQEFAVTSRSGSGELLLLETVHHQPEAARRQTNFSFADEGVPPT